jgi:hypothetical protein
MTQMDADEGFQQEDTEATEKKALRSLFSPVQTCIERVKHGI